MIRTRTAVTILATAGVCVVGAAGIASAVDTSSAPASPGGTAVGTASTDLASTSSLDAGGQGIGDRLGWRPLHRALHGQVVVTNEAGNGTQTLDVQRGTVKTVSPTAVTVQSTDNFTQTYTLDGKTKIRAGKGQDSTIGDVKAGDKAVVVAVQDGTAHTAKAIVARPPA